MIVCPSPCIFADPCKLYNISATQHILRCHLQFNQSAKMIKLHQVIRCKASRKSACDTIQCSQELSGQLMQSKHWGGGGQDGEIFPWDYKKSTPRLSLETIAFSFRINCVWWWACDGLGKVSSLGRREDMSSVSLSSHIPDWNITAYMLPCAISFFKTPIFGLNI